MGPLPKRKLSRRRKWNRRSHDAIALKQLAVCENCGEYHVAHHVCPNCGSYRGQTVVEPKDEK